MVKRTTKPKTKCPGCGKSKTLEFPHPTPTHCSAECFLSDKLAAIEEATEDHEKKRKLRPGAYDVRNVIRAGWAKEAVEVFAERTGLDMAPDADGPETAVMDLLADIMHFCTQCDLDFWDILERSREHYEDEIEEEAYDDAHPADAAGAAAEPGHE